MALVDYSSGSDSAPDPEPESRVLRPKPPRPVSSSRDPKRRKLGSLPSPHPSLPPLPPAFHDLYASTVRHSTTDDPTLHQGRTRQVPHVAGNWPSHLYVEWHPSPDDHAYLAGLVDRLRARLGDGFGLNSFLVSDLGAPQPLHISLSRPFVLTTAEKEIFLDRVVSDLGASDIHPFELRCRGLEWHRTAESNRSFLVLRLRELEAPPPAAARAERDTTKDHPPAAGANSNPRLAGLLRKCNASVRAFGQPELYQWATTQSRNNGPEAGVGVDDAFHVSIAWSFAEPDDSVRRRTAELFEESQSAAAADAIGIPVDGVKAKIGNLVTHIPLPERGEGQKLRRRGSILGI